MKDIPWFEWLYACTEDWRIWSYPKKNWFNRDWRFLKYSHSHWYAHCTLCKDGKYITWRIHRLIALTYIPNPDNLPIPHHKNWVRDDNRVENLEWRTEKYNVQDGWDRGRQVSEKLRANWKRIWWHNRKKIMQLTAKEGILCRVYNSVVEASSVTWIGHAAILQCAKWRNRTSGGYCWQYVTV